MNSCLSAANVKAIINTTYTGDLDDTESRSFEYEVPEDGITIQVEVIMGSVTLYGSYTNPNPNPIWYDFLIQSIQQSRSVFIPHPTESSSRQAVQTIPFYCTLSGAAQHNSLFSINASNGTQGCTCGCRDFLPCPTMQYNGAGRSAHCVHLMWYLTLLLLFLLVHNFIF